MPKAFSLPPPRSRHRRTHVTTAGPGLLAFTAVALMAICGVRAPAAAPTEERLVSPYRLPDPLEPDAGPRIASAREWSRRGAPATRLAFEREIFGRTLVGRPPEMRFVIRENLPAARGGTATRLRVGVLFEGREDGRQMELLVYLPNQRRGPVPVFLGLNFDGNYTTTVEPDLPLPRHWVNGLFLNRVSDHRPTAAGRGIHQHMWPYAYLLERGYGVATAAYGEIEPDEPGRWRDGPRGLGPEPGEHDWGTLGVWAWGLSRAMDYLETLPQVDSRRVAVFGFSRLGKAAVWAAAQDPRFALVISQQSGAGGVALSKRLFGEDTDHLATRFPHWFAPRFAVYAGREADLPVDHHQLVALIAPRPLLVLSATTDLWSDPHGEFLGALHASPVYRLLGSKGMSATEWPPASVLIASPLGYFLRPGPHDVTLEDWQATLKFSDRHLKTHR